jgi:hypothetical protein
MKYFALITAFLLSCNNKNNSTSSSSFVAEEARLDSVELVPGVANIDNSILLNNTNFIAAISNSFENAVTKVLHQCNGFCQPDEAMMNYFTGKHKAFLDSSVLMDRRIKFSGSDDNTKFYVRTWLFKNAKSLRYISSEFSMHFDGIDFAFKSPHVVKQEGDSLHIFYVYTKGDEGKLLKRYDEVIGYLDNNNK